MVLTEDDMRGLRVTETVGHPHGDRTERAMAGVPADCEPR